VTIFYASHDFKANSQALEYIVQVLVINDLIYYQGSSEIKNYFTPQELVFKTDDTINRAVEEAVQKYQQVVSLCLKLCQFQLATQPEGDFENNSKKIMSVIKIK